MSEPAFTIGVEEEYLLVDRATRDLARDPPSDLVAHVEARLAAQGQAGQAEAVVHGRRPDIETGAESSESP